MKEIKEMRVIKIRRFENSESKLKAFVDISLGDFIVRGLRVLEGKNGLFVGMPQERSQTGRWYRIFYPGSPESNQVITNLVLEAFRKQD